MDNEEPSGDDWLLEELNDDTIEEYYLLNYLGHAKPSNPIHGGSRTGRSCNVDRQREKYDQLLHNDYFSERPLYDDGLFRRRFRMRKTLFLSIMDRLVTHDSYFSQKVDAVGIKGLSPTQKMCSAVRMLATGNAADELDDKYRMGESTILETLQRLCDGIISIYGDEFLRAPNTADLCRLLSQNSARGFPGMLGSIDCTHWEWKNCPSGWAGQFKGKESSPTVVLEIIADQDLRIWHAFFGMSGSANDINVLDRSHLFHDAMNGRAPLCTYSVNGRQYDMGYFLADGIYPDWRVFVKTISDPQGNKNKLFSSMQESVRKDVERCFGVLQSRFHILTTPCRLWNQHAMRAVIIACVILHNMIVEDERDELDLEADLTARDNPFTVAPGDLNVVPTMVDVRRNLRHVEDRALHYQLRRDLIEHLWHLHGEE